MNIMAFLIVCLAVVSIETVRSFTFSTQSNEVRIGMCRRYLEMRCVRARIRKLRARWNASNRR
jgi:hypothetical protein